MARAGGYSAGVSRGCEGTTSRAAGCVIERRPTLNRYVAGAAAGAAATIVLSALMVMKAMMGLMPQLDVIGMIATATALGAAGAWALHFGIGLAWGVLFAAVAAWLRAGGCWLRGVLFSVFAWLVMMLVLTPAAGAGLFGLDIGIVAPLATGMLHMIWGAVMGFVYGKLARAKDAPWEAAARPPRRRRKREAGASARP